MINASPCILPFPSEQPQIKKMSQQRLSLLSLFLMVLYLNSRGQVAAEIMETWCVAKPSVSDALLSQNIDYACSHVGDNDCNPIQEGNEHPCFTPNLLVSHASFAMNMYYQKNGMHYWNCNFDGSGLISLKDPSYSSCIYPGGSTNVELTTGGKWCVASASVSEERLKNNIEYACNYVDCSAISKSGGCYNPATLINHASVVMNIYYQQTGKLRSSCDFMGSGLIVTTDPSYGNCKYEYDK